MNINVTFGLKLSALNLIIDFEKKQIWPGILKEAHVWKEAKTDVLTHFELAELKTEWSDGRGIA